MIEGISLSPVAIVSEKRGLPFNQRPFADTPTPSLTAIPILIENCSEKVLVNFGYGSEEVIQSRAHSIRKSL
jgi:hypothetical protein